MKMNKRNLNNSDHGVVGIIVTLLVIGLFVSCVAMVQTIFVPKWMEQKEAEHMQEIANQFAQLKFAIDTLSLVGEENIPVSTPVTLGSDELPFLNSMRSYGDLVILPNDCKITITYISPVDPDDDYTVSFITGTIRYSSSNAYYIDQTFVYENGALILRQHSSDVMTIQPSLSVILKKDLSFNIFKISELGDKTSVGGYGTYPVQTKFIDSSVYKFKDVKSIAIETSYQNAWNLFFKDVLTHNDPEFNADVYAPDSENRVIVTFDDTSYLPTLDLKVFDIAAQISPGWVE